MFDDLCKGGYCHSHLRPQMPAMRFAFSKMLSASPYSTFTVRLLLLENHTSLTRLHMYVLSPQNGSLIQSTAGLGLKLPGFSAQMGPSVSKLLILTMRFGIRIIRTKKRGPPESKSPNRLHFKTRLFITFFFTITPFALGYNQIVFFNALV